MAGKKKDAQAADTVPAGEKENAQAANDAAAGEKENAQAADAAPVKKRPELPQYTADELIAASEKALGVPQECAAAAFKIAGKTAMSLKEAEGIVKKFMEQEVK